MVSRLPIVGVMGSGRDPHPWLAHPLGELVAFAGCHLLTGGGGGVMAEVSRAFCGVVDRKGLAIGVVRSDGFPTLDEATGERRYRSAGVNPWVEVPILTHLPLSSESPESRNHINVLTADALVALPGSAGTLSEVRLRLAYGRRVILYLGEPGARLGIGGRSAFRIAQEARDPERVLVAENLQDVGRYLGLCLKP